MKCSKIGHGSHLSLSLSSLNSLFPNVTPSPILSQAYISLLILPSPPAASLIQLLYEAFLESALL